MTTRNATTRQTRPKNRRDVILQAAAELFGSRGYHAVGIDDIGDAVGITGPAIYRHFPTKEDIMVATIERNLERMLERVTSVAPGTDDLDTLERIIATVVATELEDWDYAVVWRREARGLPRERLDHFQPRRNEIAKRITRAVRALQPDLAGIDLRLRLEAQHGIVTGVLLEGTKSQRRRHQQQIVSMGMRTLLATDVPAVGKRVHATTAPSAVERASRRELILSAAMELFAARGYRSVGIDDAGGHAGITGPSVYRHFDNKSALLSEAIRRMGSALALTMSSVLNLDASADVLLAELTARVVDLAHANPDAFVVFFNESHHLPDEERQAFDLVVGMLFDEWELLLRRVDPTLTESTARTAAQGAVGCTVAVTASGELRSYDVREALCSLLMAMQQPAGDQRRPRRSRQPAAASA